METKCILCAVGIEFTCTIQDNGDLQRTEDLQAWSKQRTISVFTWFLFIASQFHRLFLSFRFHRPFISTRGASSSLLPTIILCANLISPLRAAYPTNLITLGFNHSNNRPILQRVIHYVIPHYESFSILPILQFCQLRYSSQHSLIQFSLKARE